MTRRWRCTRRGRVEMEWDEILSTLPPISDTTVLALYLSERGRQPAVGKRKPGLDETREEAGV